MIYFVFHSKITIFKKNIERMRSIFIWALFFVFGMQAHMASAQEDNDYAHETVFGVNLNTNAGLIGGVMFRHTRELPSGKYFNFGAELVNVKHPNEIRIANNLTGNVYILGKKNYLFALRPHVGYEFVLFPKGKEDGIQIDWLVNGGLSLGFVKPYYIQFEDNSRIYIEAYDPQKHDPATKGAYIVGSGGFFRGFGNMRIVPGLHFKTGLSFEFGSFGGGVSGIEAGGMLELYPRKIELLDVAADYPTHNRAIFSSFYVNIYFGSRR
jgi:hypothetical protein